MRDWKQALDNCETYELHWFAEQAVEEINRLNEALINISTIANGHPGIPCGKLLNDAIEIADLALDYHEDKQNG